MGRTSLAWTLALLSLGEIAARCGVVPLETVHFEVNYVTTFGDSVFVVGDLPELGGDDITKSIKLVPGAFSPGNLPWSVDLAIHQGLTYHWRFVVRDDAISNLSNPANGFDLTSVMIGATSPPDPLLDDLLVFAEVADGHAEVLFHATAGDQAVPLTPVPTRPELELARLANQPNGVGIDAEIGGLPLDTPLSRVYRRANHTYNYEPQPTASQTDTIETFVVPTTTIPSTRTIAGVTGRGIRVYLPRGYAAETGRRYPTLYMHDGQNVFDPGGPFGSWSAEVVARKRIRLAQTRELLIVAIDNSSQRSAEYVPEFGNATVDNVDYNHFIVDELKPVIDQRYRTLADRENTAVAGSSFGGLASLSLALEYPQVFGKVAAFSTSFWAGATAARVSNGEIPQDVRVYLDCGDTNDGAANTIAVRDALLDGGRVLNADFFFQIGYGHQHNEAAWNARLPDALAALFPISDEPNLISLPLPVAGDLDHDCDVDIADVSALLAAYGACVSDGNYNAAADLDSSGCVDLADLSTQLAAYGQTCD